MKYQARLTLDRLPNSKTDRHFPLSHSLRNPAWKTERFPCLPEETDWLSSYAGINKQEGEKESKGGKNEV